MERMHARSMRLRPQGGTPPRRNCIENSPTQCTFSRRRTRVSSWPPLSGRWPFRSWLKQRCALSVSRTKSTRKPRKHRSLPTRSRARTRICRIGRTSACARSCARPCSKKRSLREGRRTSSAPCSSPSMRPSHSVLASESPFHLNAARLGGPRLDDSLAVEIQSSGLRCLTDTLSSIASISPHAGGQRFRMEAESAAISFAKSLGMLLGSLDAPPSPCEASPAATPIDVALSPSSALDPTSVERMKAALIEAAGALQGSRAAMDSARETSAKYFAEPFGDGATSFSSDEAKWRRVEDVGSSVSTRAACFNSSALQGEELECAHVAEELRELCATFRAQRAESEELGDLRSLSAELEESREASARLESQLQTSEALVQETASEFDACRAEAHEFSVEVRAVKQQLQTAEARQASTTRDLQALRADVPACNQREHGAASQFEIFRRAAHASVAEARQAKLRLESAEAQARTAASEAQSLRIEANASRAEARSAQAELQILEASSEAAASKLRVSRSTTDVLKVEAQSEGLAAELRTVRAEVKALRSEAQDVRHQVQAVESRAASEVEAVTLEADACKAESQRAKDELANLARELDQVRASGDQEVSALRAELFQQREDGVVRRRELEQELFGMMETSAQESDTLRQHLASELLQSRDEEATLVMHLSEEASLATKHAADEQMLAEQASSDCRKTLQEYWKAKSLSKEYARDLAQASQDRSAEKDAAERAASELRRFREEYFTAIVGAGRQACEIEGRNLELASELESVRAQFQSVEAAAAANDGPQADVASELESLRAKLAQAEQGQQGYIALLALVDHRAVECARLQGELQDAREELHELSRCAEERSTPSTSHIGFCCT
mmetsp:Transcript_40611/g.128670  ORF Transcript_40611/g.128670 Transcript_40611/m.128670 type:complete len:859 (+) Transcript_40611:499-3075(+)